MALTFLNRKYREVHIILQKQSVPCNPQKMFIKVSLSFLFLVKIKIWRKRLKEFFSSKNFLAPILTQLFTKKHGTMNQSARGYIYKHLKLVNYIMYGLSLLHIGVEQLHCFTMQGSKRNEMATKQKTYRKKRGKFDMFAMSI